MVGDQPLKVHIGLYPSDNGEIAYEIYGQLADSDDNRIIYSQGSAWQSIVPQVPVINLASLQAKCKPSTFSVSQVYDAYKMIGFEYGPAYRGIEKAYIGEDFVLGTLSLSSTVIDTMDQYILHPGLMDSALQVSSLLINASEDRLMLPFAVQELEVYSKCTSWMWVYARYSQGSKIADKMRKRDIDICDENGNVCVRLKGLSFRVVGGETDLERSSESLGTLLLEPVWKQQAVEQGKTAPQYTQHIVMLCEIAGITKDRLEGGMQGIQCITAQSGQGTVAQRFMFYAEQVFEMIQEILHKKPQGNVLIQVVVSTHCEQQLFTGLAGLLKTATLENSKLSGQIIEIETSEEIERLVEHLEENKRSAEDKHIKYRDGQRYIVDWNEVEVPGSKIKMPWKDKGVYLITGGTGGLGLIFAREIVQRVKNPTLLLSGRSELSAEKQARLHEIRDLGANVIYRQVDVAQESEATDLIQHIVEEYGHLNGIIHSAGIIKDNYIHKKTRQDIQDVLAPKVKGLVNLDEASKDLALDFVILFSSIASVMGSAGQADYATANAFMDAYAAYRNSLIRPMYRHGRTLSINWPLWKEGGMHVDAETEKMTMQRTGVVAMKTSSGIEAMYKGLASGKDEIIVMEGDVQVIKQKMLQKKASVIQRVARTEEPVTIPAEIDTGSLFDKVQSALKHDVSGLLKIKVDDIDVNAEFNQYGFDSITLTEFSNKLNKQYKLELTPTIFFEYATLQALATHLTEEHRAVFAALFAPRSRVEVAVQVNENVEPVVSQSRQRRPSRFSRVAVAPAQAQAAGVREPIAIIGMSGKFPMAEDVEAYWRNLVEGRDCIIEIPQERWDWREYYGDPSKESNKTNVKWGGFIDGVGDFDPLFFGISPREAEQMEPQQRLLMTYAWKAIEDAGYSAQSLSGTQTGVFIGTGNTGYGSLLANVDIEGASAANMSPSAGPNRVSYFLNVHGPSEPIDTACSSSLVAIHHAVLAMEDGTCDMAIVGGVNTVVTPHGHIAFDKAGALSKEGKCKTFSDRADGFAVSEGVGILVLKKLSIAEQDCDHIYGVIRGAVMNHGGRANSLTAPNPRAQAELLQTAYSRAGVDPRTVTYIEAHGTGTALGDPVEINGLKAAFKELYCQSGDPQVSSQHCGLGSVKSNIGHLSLAAGVAGVIKVLLQLQHKTLVKSLHSEHINPYIQLQDSPFYIVQETQAWTTVKDVQGRDLPRRAGVSSFGIGGVNAHVVIEEYVPATQAGEVQPVLEVSPQQPVIFVWSARNEERLKEQVQQMLNVLRSRRYSEQDLADMAYTLQVGRDAMEERLGIIAGSIKELEEKLAGVLERREGIEDVYQGKVNRASFQGMTGDEEIQEAIEKWMQRKKYGKLLDVWVRGMNIEWRQMYGEKKPKRISLPTYPFARERYWVAERSANGTIQESMPRGTSGGRAAILHPLLHQNTSDLTEQRYSSTFTGQEFFLAHHVVKGQRILPGVAHLEMAHAAVIRSVRGLQDNQTGMRIRNVVWVQPIVANHQSTQVDISLSPRSNGEIAYEVYSESERSQVKKTIYSQGSVAIGSVEETAPLNVKLLLEQCNQQVLSSRQCYEIFDAVGIHYGPGHQGIKHVYVGKAQALAELSLPATVNETADQYVLHPSMLDSALQATICLKQGSNTDQLSLPFALEELEVHSKCTSQMWAYARIRDDSAAQDKMQKMDIDICDEQGKICVRIKGITSRVVDEGAQQGHVSKPAMPESSSGSPARAFILAPVWDVIAVERKQASSSSNDRVVIIGGDQDSIGAIRQQYPKAQSLSVQSQDTIEAIAERLESGGPISHIIWVAPSQHPEILDSDEMIEQQNQGVLQIFRLIKAMLHLGYGKKDINWSVITERTQCVNKDDLVNPTHASVHGIIGAMAKEYANWKVRLIDLEDCHRWPVDLFSVPADPQGDTWAYRKQEWYKQHLISVQHAQAPQSLYRQGGVYVVVGGAGGIGEAWSEHLIRTHQAHIVWIGRREKDARIQAKIDRLASLGPVPIYIEADATDSTTMQRAYQEIKQRYAHIHGVIHSAIVLSDQSLANMSESRFKHVLASKVDVSVRIAQIFHKEALDFVLYFSSLQSFARAAGQSNYAAGCTFKDAFAQRLAQEWACAVKIMNWSYWGSVGVVATPEYQQRMAQAGVGSIEPLEAMQALEILLGGSLKSAYISENDSPFRIGNNEPG